MNTIFINGRFLGRKTTGVDGFAYELLAVVDRLVGAGGLAVQWPMPDMGQTQVLGRRFLGV